MRTTIHLLTLMLLGSPVIARAESAIIAFPTLEVPLLVSPSQLFTFAEAALRQGNIGTAESALQALAANPDVSIRAEARFRLGMVYASTRRLTEAAVLFRKILDEQPKAQRVRLELARVLDLLGDEAGARKALREAQAGALPPDVARFVDRYSAALRARKPFGASIELAVAPDSNINRATRSDTLGTVLGDFLLDGDARQRSGVGGAISGQAYRRFKVGSEATALVRAAGAGNIYRRADFNDFGFSISAGPELSFGSTRLSAEAGVTWRWFAGDLYSSTVSGSLSYLRPLGPTAQLSAAASIGAISNKRNALQSGRSYSASATYERAISSRAGVGASLSGDRQSLNDPGYSTAGAQLTLFGYRDMGAMTLIGKLSYGHLEADERLFIFPERRVDDLYRASLGMTFRQLTIGSFAPFVRVTAERNRSTVEIFNYRRLRNEIGLSRAF